MVLITGHVEPWLSEISCQTVCSYSVRLALVALDVVIIYVLKQYVQLSWHFIIAMMLSDVCLSRTSGLNREQRGLGRLELTQR